MKEQAMSFKNLFFAISTILIATPFTAFGGQIVSDNNVSFIDGNNLEINGKPIALYAIEAPALGTLCETGKKQYDCGLIARSSLMDMSAGAKIICDKAPAPYNKEKYKCLSDGYDLSEGMVYTGWAKPLGSAPELFKKLARQAKEKRRGLWRTSLK
jgi:endonuclease YncB( thermonuclease family)